MGAIIAWSAKGVCWRAPECSVQKKSKQNQNALSSRIKKLLLNHSHFMKKIITISFLVCVAVLATGCSQEKKICIENAGNWIAEHRECEFIPQEVCKEAGGIFQECASACRHQTAEEAEVMACTMQCIPMCEFGKKAPPSKEMTTPDLENCLVYFDGCNHCSLGEGEMMACTNMACMEMKEPKCIQFKTIHETKIIEEETDNLTLKVEYPKTGNKKFDKILKDFVTKRVNDFKEMIGEERISENWKNGFYITFETFNYSENMWTFKFIITQYTGGAHDNMYFETFTYDFENKKIVTFKDLFQEEHNPLWTIVPLAKEQLEGKVGASQMLTAGTEENFDNYQYFAPTVNELMIFFPPYQVAPWAAGPQVVTLKWGDINVILKPPFFLENE